MSVKFVRQVCPVDFSNQFCALNLPVNFVRQFCPSILSVNFVCQLCPSILSVNFYYLFFQSMLSVNFDREIYLSILSVNLVILINMMFTHKIAPLLNAMGSCLALHAIISLTHFLYIRYLDARLIQSTERNRSSCYNVTEGIC